MPRFPLILLLALACATGLASAQSSDRHLRFANVQVVKPGQFNCAAPCRKARPGFVPLMFGGVTACGVKSSLAGSTGYISGTMRQGQGCNTMNFVKGAARAFRVATGFQCLCVKAGTARWAADDGCPATHEQRGACRATAAAQITPKGTVFGLISSDSYACRYADRATGKQTSQLWLTQGVAKYQVLCLLR